MKHAGRVRMRHGVGDKLVYMHEALALRLKLQKASYCEVAEKWDTDSDSDVSDDEKDLNTEGVSMCTCSAIDAAGYVKQDGSRT